MICNGLWLISAASETMTTQPTAVNVEEKYLSNVKFVIIIVLDKVQAVHPRLRPGRRRHRRLHQGQEARRETGEG